MKNKSLLLSLMLILSLAASAQQKAITQTGEEVVLYNNGTWIYTHRDSLKTEEIPTSAGVFNKSINASFLLKSKRINIGCWIDPEKWKFQQAPVHDPAEYELDHVNGNMYALMLTENLDIPVVSLGNIAIQNARDVAPDLTIIGKEYRMVNGKKVLMIRMVGTIQDIRFSYYGYYYAANGGATQFLVYSSEAFMEENLSEVEELLNGLVEATE
jgi:hypothetical protein